MKYTTDELAGLALEFAAHKAMGTFDDEGADLQVITFADYIEAGGGGFPLDWETCGPIIEREGIELWKWKGDDGTYWCAHVGGRRVDTADKESLGETPLVAAMRAIVTAKLGAEVDL